MSPMEVLLIVRLGHDQPDHQVGGQSATERRQGRRARSPSTPLRSRLADSADAASASAATAHLQIIHATVSGVLVVGN